MTDYISALQLFTIGIGPSSSHTVGPMRAASSFARSLARQSLLADTARVRVALYGSLGATGPGHGTSNAIVAGLAGSEPETCDPSGVLGAWNQAVSSGSISLLNKSIPFGQEDFQFEARTRLARHSNGMRFTAFNENRDPIFEELYFSVGGGFIEQEFEDGTGSEDASRATAPEPAVPHPFHSAAELIAHCQAKDLSIAAIAWQNELALRPEAETAAGLRAIWQTMEECIDEGLGTDGILPGYLKVPRRAADMGRKLKEQTEQKTNIGDLNMEWLQAYAIAVNEQNAAGARVVTAPTNGAAGIIPAVAKFAVEFRGVPRTLIERDYLLTAAAIGSLYKRNASISGAEAGCQGEVGSACSMAAAGLTAVMGGTPRQVENAAEIAMEHNLGLTCDPVGGFVQLPCIERNAIAAGTAVAAMRLAMLGDGSHKISLDTAIETMRQTGMDMSTKYKETSLGGLAVNVVEC